jgi:predicted ribosomally synthesized peptide with SipW-like signal peptide
MAMGGIGLAAVVAALTAGTTALFTSQATIGANTFTNGTITLTTNPSTALVTFSSMMPGDVVTNPLTVTSGAASGALRYAVSSSASNGDTKALRDQLVLTVKTVDVDATVPCDGFDGTQLYTGDLKGGATGKIIGDNTTGAQAGDRALAGNTSEILCFRVSLPIGTADSFQGATTTATFTFDAEQTKNN